MTDRIVAALFEKNPFVISFHQSSILGKTCYPFKRSFQQRCFFARCAVQQKVVLHLYILCVPSFFAPPARFWFHSFYGALEAHSNCIRILAFWHVEKTVKLYLKSMAFIIMHENLSGNASLFWILFQICFLLSFTYLCYFLWLPMLAGREMPPAVRSHQMEIAISRRASKVAKMITWLSIMELNMPRPPLCFCGHGGHVLKPLCISLCFNCTW